jgi:hypothetical protein
MAGNYMQPFVDAFSSTFPNIMTDLYTAGVCMIGIFLIILGFETVSLVLFGRLVGIGRKQEKDVQLGEYGEYESKRYKKELQERTYEARRNKYGSGDDLFNNGGL